MNKFLILMCYYNRPNLVRFALKSLKNQSYKNWEVVLVDDGSDISVWDACVEILGDEIHKLKYINTYSSLVEKQKNGGSIFGLYWTFACLISNADFALMLCDDDALTEDYLENLNNFFEKNPSENWAYSYWIGYDPYQQKDFNNIKKEKHSILFNKRLNPDSMLDASQVVFKIHPFKKLNIEFAYPKTANLDSDIYRKLFPIYGDCPPINCFGQYKSISNNRLEKRQNDTHYTYSNDIDINFKPF